MNVPNETREQSVALYFDRTLLPSGATFFLAADPSAAASATAVRCSPTDAEPSPASAVTPPGFTVSVPWAWKISAQRKRSGQMERVEQRRGTVRKVTAAVEQRLLGWVQAQPDLTLAELQQKLERTHHLHVSIGRLWQVLRQMGLRLKKSRSMPANATRKPTSSGAKPSSKPSAGSRRSG